MNYNSELKTWYEARLACTDKGFDLLTLASANEILDFLGFAKLHKLNSTFLGARLNSPEVPLQGEPGMAQSHEPSRLSVLNAYIKTVYGDNLWRWVDGRTGFLIQTSSNHYYSCLQFDSSQKAFYHSEPVDNLTSSPMTRNVQYPEEKIYDASMILAVSCNEKMFTAAICEHVQNKNR